MYALQGLHVAVGCPVDWEAADASLESVVFNWVDSGVVAESVAFNEGFLSFSAELCPFPATDPINKESILGGWYIPLYHFPFGIRPA